MAIFTKSLGVEVREVSLGVGPRVVNLALGETKLIFACIPFSSFMKLTDNRFEETLGDPSRSFDKLSPLLRFLVTMSGVLLPLILALALFPSEIIERSLSAFSQLVSGALSPFGTAQELLHTGFNMIESEGLLFVLSIMIMKLMVFYLLPISPNMGLGQGIAAMLTDVTNKKLIIWQTVSALIFILFSFSWMVALISYPFIQR